MCCGMNQLAHAFVGVCPVGWKLFAGLNVFFAIAATGQFALGYIEPSPWHIAGYLMSLVGTAAVCLYAFDGKVLSLTARKGIAISFSVFAVVETVQGLWINYFDLADTALAARVVIFALPLFLSVFSVVAAWRYSQGRTLSRARF